MVLSFKKILCGNLKPLYLFKNKIKYEQVYIDTIYTHKYYIKLHYQSQHKTIGSELDSYTQSRYFLYSRISPG